MGDFFLEGNLDYAIYFDGIRVDHLIRSWNSSLNIYGGYGTANFDLIYFRELFENLDDWTDVHIFVKNIFTQKYEVVFCGNIRTYSRQISRQTKSFSIGAVDGLIWFNKVPVPIYYAIDDALDVNQKFLWAAQGIDYDAINSFATVASLQFNDMDIETMIREIFKMIKEGYAVFSEQDSVLSWAKIQERIKVMSDIDEKLRQGRILEYIVRGTSSVVSTIYVLLNDILSQLTFEYYQDNDGMIRIKQPFWGEDILKNHVIDPMMITNLSQFIDWDKRVSRVITHGGADPWQQEGSNVTSILIPMGAYIDGKMFQKGISIDNVQMSGISPNIVVPNQNYEIATTISSAANGLGLDPNILYKAIEIKTNFNFEKAQPMYDNQGLSSLGLSYLKENDAHRAFLDEFANAAQQTSVELFHIYSIGYAVSNLKHKITKITDLDAAKKVASGKSLTYEEKIYETPTGRKGIMGLPENTLGSGKYTYNQVTYDIRFIKENILCGANIFKDYLIYYSGNFELSLLAYAFTREVINHALFLLLGSGTITYSTFQWEKLLEIVPRTSSNYLEMAYDAVFPQKKGGLFSTTSENISFVKKAIGYRQTLCEKYIGRLPVKGETFSLEECLGESSQSVQTPSNTSSFEQVSALSTEFKNLWDKNLKNYNYEIGILYAAYALGEEVISKAKGKMQGKELTWTNLKETILNNVNDGDFLEHISTLPDIKPDAYSGLSISQVSQLIQTIIKDTIKQIDASLSELKLSETKHVYAGSTLENTKEWKNKSSTAPDLVVYLTEDVETLGGANEQGKFGALRKASDENGNVRFYHHKGVDITMAGGTRRPLYCIGDARIVSTEDHGSTGYGKTVVYQINGTDIRVRYAHMSEIHVVEGEIVKDGTKIGLQGSTGNSTGPHIHIEVTVNGAYYDPVLFLAQYAPNFICKGSNYNNIAHKLSPGILVNNLKEFSIICRWDRVSSELGIPSDLGKRFPELEFGKSITGNINIGWEKASVDNVSVSIPEVRNLREMTDISEEEKKHGINTFISNQPLIKNTRTEDYGVYEYNLELTTNMLTRHSKYMYNLLNSRVNVLTLNTLPMPWLRPGFNTLVDPCTINKVYYINSVSYSGSADMINQTLGLSFGRDPENYTDFSGNAFVSRKKYGSEAFGKTLKKDSLFKVIEGIKKYHNSTAEKEHFAHMNRHYIDLYGEEAYAYRDLKLCGVLGWREHELSELEEYFSRTYQQAPETIKKRRAKLLNALRNIEEDVYKTKLTNIFKKGLG